MNFFSKNNSTIGTIIAVVVVLAGIYWYFFTDSSAPASPLSQSAAPAPAEAQFLDLAGELQPVSFDTTIFSDPRFATLQDISTPIAPEAEGRIDPFAPRGK